MGVRRSISLLVTAAVACLPFGAALAQDYALCVKLEAQLFELDRGPTQESTVNIFRYDGAIVDLQRNLQVARQQAARAGCGRQTGFLFFRPQRPAGCAQYDANIKQLETNLQRMQGQRNRTVPVRSGPDEAERRRILAMLGENKCGPQYERYAPNRNRGLFSLFFRDYTRDPYATEQRGSTNFYGTYRTLCVRTCDGYYWPVSFSTVQTHFDYDEQLCKQSCPGAEVELFVHRNPGEGPEQAMSLAGDYYNQSANAFRYRSEYVPDCSCKAAIETASLGERVIVNLPARDGISVAPDPWANERTIDPATVEPEQPQIAIAPIPLPRNRPGNEPPVAGSIATVTGMEDYYAVPAPTVDLASGKAVRVVGPGFTLYRSSGVE